MVIFYGEELITLRPTSNLEDHPFSAVRDCLFSVFAATLHSRRPFHHPQPEDAPCRGDRAHFMARSRENCLVIKIVLLAKIVKIISYTLYTVTNPDPEVRLRERLEYAFQLHLPYTSKKSSTIV
jgi:hypothetical protein